MGGESACYHSSTRCCTQSLRPWRWNRILKAKLMHSRMEREKQILFLINTSAVLQGSLASFKASGKLWWLRLRHLYEVSEIMMKKWCSIAYRVFMDSENLKRVSFGVFMLSKLWLISQIFKNSLKMTVASLYYDEEICVKILSQENTKLCYNSVSSVATHQYISNVHKHICAGAVGDFFLLPILW